MKIIRILTPIILLLLSIFYFLDKQLFFVGRNDLKIYNLLPFNIKTDYNPDYGGGFSLTDEKGFSISKGDTYHVKGKYIKINKIIKYGYNESQFVIQIEDTTAAKHYLKLSLINKISTYISEIFITKDELRFYNSIIWVDIDNESNYKNEMYHTALKFILLPLILIVVYKLIKQIWALFINSKFFNKILLFFE